MYVLIKKILIGVLIMGCCGSNCGCNKNGEAAIVNISSEKISKTEEESQESKVEYNKDDIIVIQYSAKWCGPCNVLKANIKSDQELQEFLKKETKGYFIVDVDDKDERTLAWLSLEKPTSLPTVVAYKFRNKKWTVADKFISARPSKYVLQWLKKIKTD
jgi:thiol:disulfide interchange protein